MPIDSNVITEIIGKYLESVSDKTIPGISQKVTPKNQN